MNRKAGRQNVALSKKTSCLPVFLSILLSQAACGGSATPPAASAPSSAERDRQQVADFAALEAQVLERVAASDPRLAVRLGVVPSRATLSRIETEGVLAEDAKATLRGASLDPFAFGGRLRTLAGAERELASWKTALPDAGAALARPRLERELVARLIEEERARVGEESSLDDGAGPLVRGVVATWSPGASVLEWHEHDVWIARRLMEIAASLKTGRPRAAPSELEPALYDLEKVLVPMQFPRGVAALTSLHEALDQDDRPDLPATPPELLAARVRAHLGVATPLPQLAAAIEAARARVASDYAALTASLAPAARDAIEKNARARLFVEQRCTAGVVPPGNPSASAPLLASPVRRAAPPPERATICAALTDVERAATATASRDDRAASLLALHDTLVGAGWASVPPIARARGATLSFRGDEDLADRMKQLAASRPVSALAAALAIERTYGVDAIARARAWLAFGDAPLDVVERELAVTGSPPPASPRP